MRALDTNVLVRLIARDDEAQFAVAESFVRPGSWVSLLALAEAVWVLGSSYGFSTSAQAMAVQMLLGQDDLVMQDADTVKAALALFRERPALGFSDCLILEIARKAGHVPLGTFDRNLARVHGTERLRP